MPSAVYVDLVYQWSAFLSCAVNEDDARLAFKEWTSNGKLYCLYHSQR